MKYPDDIDFVYILENHGWSTCHIYIEGAIFEMSPTHIFGNPIVALLDGLICLLRGDNEVNFKWHDEPGEYNWSIKRNKEQQHKVTISITNCYQINSPETLKPKQKTIEFEVKLKLFTLCVLKQMEKIRDLMAEKSFSEHRRNEFPFSSFKEFEHAYVQTYS